MPRNPNKTPCNVPGCRAWAIRGSHPPRCSAHRHTALAPTGPPASAPSPGAPFGPPAPGAPAQPAVNGPAAGPAVNGPAPAPAPRVGAPPGNQNRLVHGFYSQALSTAEQEDIAAFDAGATLDAEIAITRVALRRILAMLLTGMTPGANPKPLEAHDYARYAELAFRGASTVGRLLRARHALGGGQTDTFSQWMNQALAELGEEWGIELI